MRGVMSSCRYVVMAIAALLLAGCHYKDLCYDHNHDTEYNLSLQLKLQLDLDVNLDVTEEAHTKIELPTYMKVCFYNPETGALVQTEYVETYGGRLHVAPGTYDMVVYSFGTEWTQIRGESLVNTLEAFTSDITMTKRGVLRGFTRSEEYEAPGPIIYTPDHLLVTRKRVEIPPFSAEEHVISITATAATVVETYSFEVKNIVGVDYISSVEAFVTNQAQSTFFGRDEKSQEPATIYFPMEVNHNTHTLKTTFNTFGKLPGESKSYLHILIKDSGGTEHRITEDITDQFLKPNHEIIIDQQVVIPVPESGGGGGISPTVDQWEDEIHDVPIG